MLSRVQAEVQKRSENDRRDVLREIQRIAKKRRVDLVSLLDSEGGGAIRKAAASRSECLEKRRKIAPKYRHPKQKALTWTGEDAGRSGLIEQLTIKK